VAGVVERVAEESQGGSASVRIPVAVVLDRLNGGEKGRGRKDEQGQPVVCAAVGVCRGMCLCGWSQRGEEGLL